MLSTTGEARDEIINNEEYDLWAENQTFERPYQPGCLEKKVIENSKVKVGHSFASSIQPYK